MWETVKLTEIATVTTGKWDANHASDNGEYRFYTCASKHMYSETKRFSGECLILPGNGANVGDVYYFNGDFDAYQRTYVIHDIKILPKFLMYHMAMNWRFVNESKQFGSATNFIKIGNFKDYDVSFPPLAEQERIVAKLDAAFAEIDKAVENLKNKKMNLKKLMDSVLERFFNNESFDEYELKDVCTFVGGSQPPKSEFEYEESENNIRLIQIRDYKSDRHIVYIPKDKARRFCTKDDVMIGRYGPPIFQILRGIEGSYNVALMKAIPKENILNDYLFYFLKNRRIQNFVINKSSRAAGQSGVNKDALEPYIINLPSLDIQKNICKASKELELQDTYLSNLYKKKLDNLMLLKSAILAQELQSEAA